MSLSGIWLALAGAAPPPPPKNKTRRGEGDSKTPPRSGHPNNDETLEQFHGDGTEFLISAGLPPALVNVCAGVWTQTSPRGYRLRHMTWGWSPEDSGWGVPGTFAGTFEVVVDLIVDRRGNRFTGTWVARNFDPDGNHIPELDAQGVVRATRITVEGGPFVATASEMNERSVGFARGCG
jgi:hypothetical protein